MRHHWEPSNRDLDKRFATGVGKYTARVEQRCPRCGVSRRGKLRRGQWQYYRIDSDQSEVALPLVGLECGFLSCSYITEEDVLEWLAGEKSIIRT